MNNKLLVFIFGLFIIYLLCKKNIIKGGEVSSKLMDYLNDFSIPQLSSVLNEKKIKKNLNAAPPIDPTQTNYQLFLSERNNPDIIKEIELGTYWVHKIDKFGYKMGIDSEELTYNSLKMKKTPLLKQKNLYMTIVKEKKQSIANAEKIKNNFNEK